MSTTKIWRGDAPAIAQIWPVYPPAGITSGETLRITINGKSVEFVATASTVANVTAGLATAIAASDIPEFAEITATDKTTYLELKAATAGVPFTAVVSYIGAVHTTAVVAYNASAATLQTALEGLPQIESGDVSVTGSAGGPYTLTYGGTLANTEIQEIIADGSGLTGAGDQSATVVTFQQGDAANDEVQIVTLNGTPTGGTFTLTQYATGVNEIQTATVGNVPTGGTFTLTYSGQTTGTIAWNASAATVQTALEALSNITAGDVIVSGGAGGPWQIAFAANLADVDVAAITSTVTGLTGGDAVVTITETVTGNAGVNEVQTVTVNGATGGTFTLTFGDQTTGTIAYNASAATVDTALESLSNIAAGDVTCTGGALPGTAVVVTFTGNLAATDVSLMVADGALLTGGASGNVAEITPGAAGTAEVQHLNVVTSGWPTSPVSALATWTPKFAILPSDAIFSTQPLGVLRDPTTVTAANIDADIDLMAALIALGGLSPEFYGTGNTTTADLTGSIFDITYDANLLYKNVDPLIFKKYYEIDAGFAVTIDTQGTGSVNEAATLTFDNIAPGTSTEDDYEFRIRAAGGTWSAWDDYNSVTTGSSISTSKVEAKIDALSEYSAGGVVATWSGSGDDVTLDFAGALALTNVPDIEMEIRFNETGNETVSTTTNGVAGADEVQRVTLTGTPTTGTFTLTYNAEETTAIAYDATAADVAAAINALPQFASVAVCSGTGGALPGAAVDITFDDGGYQGTDLALMTIDASELAMNITETTPGVPPTNEQQAIDISGQSIHGGDFTLTFWGNTTAAINYNATAAALETALELLASIDDVTVTGGDGPETAWTVEFKGTNAATDVAMMTSTPSFDNGTVTITETLKGHDFIIGETASEGPNHADTPGNWVGAALPITGDTVWINQGKADILYGLDTLAAVLLAKLYITQAYTGKIGLPQWNANEYYEYRPLDFAIGATQVWIGHNDGSGPTRINLDLGSNQTAIEMHDTGSSADSTRPTAMVNATHASNTLSILDGSIGMALRAGELSTVNVTQRGGDVRLGSGVTLKGLVRTGGDFLAEGVSMSSATIEVRA